MQKYLVLKTNSTAEELVVDRDKDLFGQLYDVIGCDLIEIVRSSVIDAGSDSRIVLLVDESGAIKLDREFNPIASCICGQTIFGTVVIGQEIDGEDGGEVVGLETGDRCRILSFTAAIRAFLIRDPNAFITQLIKSMTLGFASTVPQVSVDLFAFGDKIADLIGQEYDQILERLREEYGNEK